MSDQPEEQWRVLAKSVGPWQFEGSVVGGDWIWKVERWSEETPELWGSGLGKRAGNTGDQLGEVWLLLGVTPSQPWLALAGWRVSERETRGSPVSQLSLFPPSSASGKGSEPSTGPDSEGNSTPGWTEWEPLPTPVRGLF